MLSVFLIIIRYQIISFTKFVLASSMPLIVIFCCRHLRLLYWQVAITQRSHAGHPWPSGGNWYRVASAADGLAGDYRLDSTCWSGANSSATNRRRPWKRTEPERDAPGDDTVTEINYINCLKEVYKSAFEVNKPFTTSSQNLQYTREVDPLLCSVMEPWSMHWSPYITFQVFVGLEIGP